MKKPPDPTPMKNLRDAYKVSGFRVRARIDSYDELAHPAFSSRLIGAQKNGVRWMREGLPQPLRSTLAAGARSWLRRPGSLSRLSMRRVSCTACGVKNEKLAFLSGNTKYTLRFATQIGGLCRAMTIKDVARQIDLDWHAVKDLDKLYMREQLARAGHPAPNVIGVDEVSIRKRHVYRGSWSATWNGNARYGSAEKAAAKRTWTCFTRF